MSSTGVGGLRHLLLTITECRWKQIPFNRDRLTLDGTVIPKKGVGDFVGYLFRRVSVTVCVRRVSVTDCTLIPSGLGAEFHLGRDSTLTTNPEAYLSPTSYRLDRPEERDGVGTTQGTGRVRTKGVMGRDLSQGDI